jgi:hypothetical protein
VELIAPGGRNSRRLALYRDVFAFDLGKERCRRPDEAVCRAASDSLSPIASFSTDFAGSFVTVLSAVKCPMRT